MLESERALTSTESELAAILSTRCDLVCILGDFFVSKGLEWGEEAKTSFWKFHEQATLFPTLGFHILYCPNITSFGKPSLMLPSQLGSRGKSSCLKSLPGPDGIRPSVRTRVLPVFWFPYFSPTFKCLLACCSLWSLQKSFEEQSGAVIKE